MSARILVFDIETAPIVVYAWSLFDQHTGLNQVVKDWHLIAWAAKWLGDPPSKVMYMDNRKAKDVQNDKALVKGLSRLINEADIVVTQNGEQFDIKRLNARAVINGLPPVKPVKHTDIYKEGHKVFSFTSHKLDYVTKVLNKKYKKLSHREYPGFELWKAVLEGDKKAWRVMEKYTKYDVLATEEAYQNLQGWIKTQNLAAYDEDMVVRCPCGSDKLTRQGYAHTDKGKFQQFKCQTCGKWSRSTVNLFNAEKKRSLLKDKA